MRTLERLVMSTRVSGRPYPPLPLCCDAATGAVSGGGDGVFSGVRCSLGAVTVQVSLLRASGPLLSPPPPPLPQSPAMESTRVFLRGLTSGKKFALVGMLSLSALQLMGIMNVVSQLVVLGTDSFVSHAPMVLLSIMLGIVLEVCGVLYILVPSAPVSTEEYLMGMKG